MRDRQKAHLVCHTLEERGDGLGDGVVRPAGMFLGSARRAAHVSAQCGECASAHHAEVRAFARGRDRSAVGLGCLVRGRGRGRGRGRVRGRVWVRDRVRARDRVRVSGQG